jgi:hypothetical protein
MELSGFLFAEDYPHRYDWFGDGLNDSHIAAFYAAGVLIGAFWFYPIPGTRTVEAHVCVNPVFHGLWATRRNCLKLVRYFRDANFSHVLARPPTAAQATLLIRFGFTQIPDLDVYTYNLKEFPWDQNVEAQPP